MNEEILERIINGNKHILVSGPKGSGKTTNILFPIVDKLISKKTGIPVMIAEESISCVALGTGRALEDQEMLEKLDAMRKKTKY